MAWGLDKREKVSGPLLVEYVYIYLGRVTNNIRQSKSAEEKKPRETAEIPLLQVSTCSTYLFLFTIPSHTATIF